MHSLIKIRNRAKPLEQTARQNVAFGKEAEGGKKRITTTRNAFRTRAFSTASYPPDSDSFIELILIMLARRFSCRRKNGAVAKNRLRLHYYRGVRIDIFMI